MEVEPQTFKHILAFIEALLSWPVSFPVQASLGGLGSVADCS